MMDASLAARILHRLPKLSVAVLGDYCLDHYVYYDPAQDETSRETGRPAHQATQARCFPGAAGTVCANLAALGFGRVDCYGVTGDDGAGYELRRGLKALGCDTQNLLADARMTNTYMKPMARDGGGWRETERLDFRTREPVPETVLERLAQSLEQRLSTYAAVLVVDQFDDPRDCLVSPKLLGWLSALARAHDDVVFYADSRVRVGDFLHFYIKCNHLEAGHLFGEQPCDDALPSLARRLARRTGRPAFVTLGERGMLASDGQGATLSPTLAAQGPVDIVGAGDAASSGLVAALCCGAALGEAAFFGNLIASITIEKIGVTGTASPEEIMERAERFTELRARVYIQI